MTLMNERFVQFAKKSNGRISEIIVDTADELPEADGIQGKILHHSLQKTAQAVLMRATTSLI